MVRDETTGDITAADKVFNCEKVFEIVNGELVDITDEVEEFQKPDGGGYLGGGHL